MALILCKQRAAVPYYYEKLDLRIWSYQELCFLIFNYPLMVSEGFFTEDLISWLSREVAEKDLARRLTDARAAGESDSNMLLMMLSRSGYYKRNEINAYMDKLMELGRLERYEYLRETGKSFFRAGRARFAFDKLEEAAKAVDEELRKGTDAAGKDKLLRAKADLYLDMAVIKIRLFEDKKALELILRSELLKKTDRAREMRYLLTGEAELSDDDKKRLDIKKEEIKLDVLSGIEYKDVTDIFEKDSVKAGREAAKLLGRLKKDYRRMT